jgi:hypothetical protein
LAFSAKPNARQTGIVGNRRVDESDCAEAALVFLSIVAALSEQRF